MLNWGFQQQHCGGSGPGNLRFGCRTGLRDCPEHCSGLSNTPGPRRSMPGACPSVTAKMSSSYRMFVGGKILPSLYHWIKKKNWWRKKILGYFKANLSIVKFYLCSHTCACFVSRINLTSSGNQVWPRLTKIALDSHFYFYVKCMNLQEQHWLFILHLIKMLVVSCFVQRAQP